MQAPPGLLSLLPLLPSLFLSSLSLPRLSNYSKINRQINEWIHGCGRVKLLSAVLPWNAAQRGKESASAFSGKYFLWLLSAIHPPLDLPLEPLSPVRVFSVVVHACSCVPLSLFVGVGPTQLNNLNALWWGAKLSGQTADTQHPSSFSNPPHPFLPQPPYPTTHIIGSTKAYAH